MLNKKLRLRKNSSFRATYLQKKIVSDEFFILYGGRKKENEDYPTRVGFVVSKKIHKRAVKRNKIKRRLRESFRNAIKNDELVNWTKFQSLIYVSRQTALNADLHTIYSSVTKLMAKLANKFY